MEYRVTNSVEPREKAEIYNALLEYNLERLKGNTPEELGVFLEEDGRRLAGLIGETHGNWLTVKYLWVAEAVRGRRVGSELLQRAEDIARARGCKYVFLDTFSFQAPGFYLKVREVEPIPPFSGPIRCFSPCPPCLAPARRRRSRRKALEYCSLKGAKQF